MDWNQMKTMPFYMIIKSNKLLFIMKNFFLIQREFSKIGHKREGNVCEESIPINSFMGWVSVHAEQSYNFISDTKSTFFADVSCVNMFSMLKYFFIDCDIQEVKHITLSFEHIKHWEGIQCRAYSWISYSLNFHFFSSQTIKLLKCSVTFLHENCSNCHQTLDY